MQGWKKITLKGGFMKRFAVLLLAAAGWVAAQTATQTKNAEMEQLSIKLQEKLHIAIQEANESIEKAKQTALEYQNRMKGKSPEEAKKIMEQHRAEMHERLQGAIEALERASTKVGAQVEEVRERIQTRLQEKKQELIELQARIRAREEAREAEKGEGKEGSGKGGKAGDAGAGQ